MHRRYPSLAAALLAAVLCAACAQPPGETTQRPGTTRLLVVGSGTMAPLVKEIGKRFERTHPGVLVEVRPGEPGAGLAEVLHGHADVGMATRVPAHGEAASFLVARDALGVIVHKRNAVASLSREQLAAIYTGRITDWKDVGGRPGRIIVITARPQYEGLEQFRHFVGLREDELKAELALGDDTDRLAAVAARPGGIAFLSSGTAAYLTRWGVPVKRVRVDADAALRADGGPLASPLLLVTRAAPSALAKEFVDFALSPAAAALVRSYDFGTDIE